MTFAEILAEKGAEAGLSFTPLQLEQFSRYYELLVETNKVMNLTAITEPEDVAVKHMVDSLLAYEGGDGRQNLGRRGHGRRLSRCAAENLLPRAEGYPD